MNTFFKKRKSGFTVIELMIVLIIIAILVALAYPSYTRYARKAKRGEAQQLLLNWAINQEIFRSNNPQYDDGTIIPEPCSGAEADCDYGFVVSETTATTYTLTANAIGDQANDTARSGESCAQLELNQNGVKSPAACWE